ncbi:type I-C CRISPR-associated protein Cas8c/Csd1 [Candidatus Chloroploca asiatica]|uniref:Type I-C CRISPR-associated protein Cas8c/Csd1 n=1 Tax=Candidatus Chloroploca asiatica TaxID=1506545 RepID=A0A2H3KP68_9CHLR|nr:type I-C CRISPR-associated protein Cas8c/Csd1 [Candidatus Chloroploca asiatica]PDV96936.1 type I-C CRISPR-associated protein Cas8c/Csd1 [Candidatus Chloroploca asiatica]
MLLQRLKEYADERMALPPTLYSEMPVRYIIELDFTGKLLSPYPTDTADPANARTKRGTQRYVPQVQRANVIRPLLFADKADYTLGLGGEQAKPERVRACHQAYCDLVARCAADTQEVAVQAILAFVTNDPTGKLQLPDDFDPSALITFRVDGEFPTELPGVQEFWAQEHNPASRNATIMQCLICGRERPVLTRLQGKIKGIPGGQTAGTSVISANEKAFESYGLEASLVAPTCADCGERFTKALNHLLGDQESRFVLGNTIFVYWTKRPITGLNLHSMLSEPQAHDVKALRDSAYLGRAEPEVDATAFYAIVLSAGGGRAVIRDWIDATVGVVKQNLHEWFARQQIVNESGQIAAPLGIARLADATLRIQGDGKADREGLIASIPPALLSSALLGTPVPVALLAQVIGRARAEQRVTLSRAALIKLILVTHYQQKENTFMVALDPAHPDPGYQCGRLLAVLADIQDEAIGTTTVVERFFGTASSAPQLVFHRLVRGAQPHLTKLARDNERAYYALDRRLEEILSQLQGFPTVLTLEQQGLFMLGFYHQRAFNRAQARAARERKQAENPAQESMFSDA